MTNWEQIKKGEKGTDSIVEGISPGLPSLLYAHKLYRKAASVGLEPGHRRRGARPRGDSRSTRCATADPAATEAVLGDLLAAAVVLARARGVDAETALRGWSAAVPRPVRAHGAARRSAGRRPRRRAGGLAWPRSGSRPAVMTARDVRSVRLDAGYRRCAVPRA